jgi:hypothetical protein
LGWVVAALLPGYATAVAREYIIDGRRTSSLEAFFEEFSSVALNGARWGFNLDAFNDVLRGGFGTPDEGFVLRWAHSEVARQSLGYAETARQLELRLQQCHIDNRPQVRMDLSNAENGVGPTVFDWLLEILAVHGPGGDEACDNVRLLLE